MVVSTVVALSTIDLELSTKAIVNAYWVDYPICFYDVLCQQTVLPAWHKCLTT